MRREPLPSSPVQGIAPLPEGREGPEPPSEEDPPAEDAPEPLLDGVHAGRSRHQFRPPRPPAAHRRAGRGRPVRPTRAAPVGPHRAPGPGGGPGRGRQPGPLRSRRPDPRTHPGPIGEPPGQQPGGRTDHPVPCRRPQPSRGGGSSGRADRGDHPAGAGHHRRPPLQPVPARAGSDQCPQGRHPLHQRAPGRLPWCVLGPDHRADLPAGRTAGSGPGRLSGVPDAGLRVHHQRHRAAVRGVEGVPGRRRLRPVRPRVPVRVGVAGHPG